MTEKKLAWFWHIPTFAGTLVGIALTAIGGVMVLNVVLKLYVFGFETPEYTSNYEQMCLYDEFSEVEPLVFDGQIETIFPQKENRKKLTVAERESCIAKKEAEDKKRYLRSKKENFVDGLAMLLVGVPFWVFFTRRKEIK